MVDGRQLRAGQFQSSRMALGTVIEQGLRKAVDAARHAATLEPANDEARSLVKDRRARLAKLGSKR